jgi:hypothetical protein
MNQINKGMIHYKDEVSRSAAYPSFPPPINDGQESSSSSPSSSSLKLRWELQLKGGGTTPFCRGADGRAVLRSSVLITFIFNFYLFIQFVYSLIRFYISFYFIVFFYHSFILLYRIHSFLNFFLIFQV